ncbi:glutathione S-transferase N-terminal domain-containing protein [Pasteurellaceae bacterium LIM206]|nr:glutathione S-transferase N-terminal domain-containing protein [Pasteurellaceae bacterium LIM206]
MKLWYTTTSPFARKAVATMKYHQLESQVEMLRATAAFDADSPHNKDNPLGRVPALQMRNGEWLFGSFWVAEYLDAQGAKPTLFPTNIRRWDVLALHALADGILENTTTFLPERMFRPQQEWWISRHQQLMDRNTRSFRQLEDELDKWGDELNIGTLAAVCLIDWWAFRSDKIGYNLAADFPKLAAYAEMMNRKYAVLAETKPAA